MHGDESPVGPHTTMQCPFCAEKDTRVVDSRLVGEGDQVRRRRECSACRERFTTYEKAELNLPRVVKSDGRRVPFDGAKLESVDPGVRQWGLPTGPAGRSLVDEHLRVVGHDDRPSVQSQRADGPVLTAHRGRAQHRRGAREQQVPAGLPARPFSVRLR